MTIFCIKKIAPAISLGKKLRDARERVNLSVEELSNRTHLQSKYITAIEAGEFSSLPKAKAYRLAYIKEYAAAVGLASDACITEFTRQDGLENAGVIHPHRAIKHFRFASLSLVFRNVIVTALALLFVGYLGWQVRRVIEPPDLAVYSPNEGEVTTQLSATIQGATEPEVQLKINGQTAVVNDEGRFETAVDLSPGINTITITAVKKHGKTTTITRHLIVRQKVVRTETNSSTAILP